MNRIYRRAGTLLLAALAGCASSPSSDPERPNIILIMADDIGVEGIGCYGGLSYRTPEIDRLAGEGLRFTQAYSTPLCTNTRLSVMTGLYNHRNWIAFGLLDPKARTIGHVIRDAGYRACIAGKWQLQSYDPPDYPGAETRRGRGMHPKDAGFHEYSLFHSLHTEDKGSRYADPTYLENGTLKRNLKGKYGPDLWVDAINGFMTRHRDEPFLVYYPMALPHWPMVPTPDSPEWKHPARRHEENVRYYKDMVEYMDACVGRIVRKVDALGLSEKTLILFYSDNGTHLKITSRTTTGDVAGGKGLTTHAGIHVPLIARWTGRIRPGLIDDLVESTDFLPTLAEAAGADVPPGLDGRSFYPRLLGRPGNPREWAYCFYDPRPGWDKDQFRRQVFAWDARWKLYEDGRLFDVTTDRLEKSPIEGGGPAARAARERLAGVLRSMQPR